MHLLPQAGLHRMIIRAIDKVSRAVKTRKDGGRITQDWLLEVATAVVKHQTRVDFLSIDSCK